MEESMKSALNRGLNDGYFIPPRESRLCESSPRAENLQDGTVHLDASGNSGDRRAMRG
jgi:hypothetical protein